MFNNQKDFILRFLVILMAAIAPFIYIGSIGELPSISSYWITSMQPIFIIVNASTSYFLFSLNRWRIPAVMLLLLTAFSFNNNESLHNIFAICFFLFNFYPLLLNKKINWMIVPYSASILFLFHSILYAEIFAITILCLFHLHELLRYNRIQKQRKLRSYTA